MTLPLTGPQGDGGGAGCRLTRVEVGSSPVRMTEMETAESTESSPESSPESSAELERAEQSPGTASPARRTLRPWADQPRSKVISAFIVSAALALGLALVLVGVGNSVTGREQSNLPDEIERVQPGLGDKVLNQANIVVDLAPGYTGRLIIDDVALVTESTAEAEPTGGNAGAPTTTIEIDPDAVRFDAGTNTLSFQPGPQTFVERFDVGRHLVKVIYWKQTESEVSSFSYTWYFDVTA